MTPLDQALEYLSKGLTVIPLQPRGKVPLATWKYLQEGQLSPAQVTKWWSKWPKANVGIVTGQISNVIVIDVDSLDAWTKFREYLPPDYSYRIPKVGTGKGTHLYFKYPNYHVGNRQGLLRDVDVRGEGGYSVAPPSIHEDGRQYKWINTCDFNFPDIPQLLGELLNTKGGNLTPRSSVDYEVLVPSNTDPTKTYRVRLMSSGRWTCNHRWWRPGDICAHIKWAMEHREEVDFGAPKPMSQNKSLYISVYNKGASQMQAVTQQEDSMADEKDGNNGKAESSPFKSIGTMTLKENGNRNTGISAYIRSMFMKIPENQGLAMATLVKNLLANDELKLKDMHQAYIRIGNVLKSQFGQNFRKMKDDEDNYTYIAWKEGKGPDSVKGQNGNTQQQEVDDDEKGDEGDGEVSDEEKNEVGELQQQLQDLKLKEKETAEQLKEAKEEEKRGDND